MFGQTLYHRGGGLDGGASAGPRCLPTAVLVADVVLSIVDGSIAAVAFLQLLRIHLCNQRLGWTRQKMFHLLVGSSNLGYLAFFVVAIIATCDGWLCWSHGCGFILMACPQILFLAAFLLLLSYWVDLCHQANDEDEDDEYSFHEALLDNSKSRKEPLHGDGRRKCGCLRVRHIGSRQKFVILVIAFTFVCMIAFAVLIWIGRGKNPVDSFLMARVYLDVFSGAVLVLGGALACYGLVLFSKMRKVRSEMASTEMWKVASLAAVSLICFTSSSMLSLVANIPLQVLFYWNSAHSDHINKSIFMFLYYLIGSSIPSGFVLWVMREMPPQIVSRRPVQSRVETFIREELPVTQNPQWRASVTSSQSKALKASPI